MKKFLLKHESLRSLIPTLPPLKSAKSMSEKDETSIEDLEQEVFKPLENQKRRDLRLIGERKGVTFTEILNTSKIPDSPILSYYLRALAPFVEQRDGKYYVSPIGKDAYSLLLKTATYSKVAVFQSKRFGATFGNLLLWLIGMAAAAYLGVDYTFTLIIMPFLAFIATGTTYQLFKEVS